MSTRIRLKLLAAMAAAAFTLPTVSAQEAWPSRPIRIVVPLAAGGISDVMARTLAEEMRKSLNVAVIVENRPGANFFIGMQAVASAKPDGYTIAWMTSSSLTLNPIHYKDKGIPYKVSDFQLLTTLFRGHQLLAVPKSSSANNLADFVAQAKRGSAPVIVGVSSKGGSTHLMMEDLASTAGFTVQPVVYRGEPPAVQDLVAGNLPSFVGVLPSLIEQHRAGQVKLLGISADKRVAGIPDVPTFKEQGYANIDTTYWAALGVPAGTPREIVDKLHKAITDAAQSPAFAARLQPDMEITTTTPEQLTELVKRESQKWERLVREKNISID